MTHIIKGNSPQPFESRKGMRIRVRVSISHALRYFLHEPSAAHVLEVYAFRFGIDVFQVWIGNLLRPTVKVLMTFKYIRRPT